MHKKKKKKNIWTGRLYFFSIYSPTYDFFPLQPLSRGAKIIFIIRDVLVMRSPDIFQGSLNIEFTHKLICFYYYLREKNFSNFKRFTMELNFFFSSHKFSNWKKIQ